uniref:Large ribosomal subunit protein bL28m n=1 Tax=Chenopodium quinoa TaxID=63459 RepID=A0A803MDB7_CHEQI
MKEQVIRFGEGACQEEVTLPGRMGMLGKKHPAHVQAFRERVGCKLCVGDGYHEKRGLSGRSDPARKEGAARKKHLAHVQAFKENVGWKLCVGDYVVVAVYTARSRRTWKPNVQEKRLFSYILDRHIRVHVTTHALRCIDKAGGIDEYLLKTPYHKMDTEMGLLWKAKIEKMYEELGKVEVSFFSPEDEAKFEQSFKEMKLDEKTARREFRRQLYGRSSTPEATSDPKDGESDGGGSGYGNSHSDHEQLVANA